MYLRCKIDVDLEIYKNLHHRKILKKSNHKHQVYIGVGGNILDVKRRLEKLYIFLNRDKRVAIQKVSSILKNPPFGFLDQDYFYNSVIVLKTSMLPMQFLDYLMRVEKRFLRKRSFKDAPRTLDLDIIFYDNVIVNKPRLKIPHPHWHERESVLIPLMEVL